MDIKFKYSIQYEKTLNPEIADLKDSFVSVRIDYMNSFWSEYRDTIINQFKELTGLSFNEESLICYLNSKISLSDPLSLKMEDFYNMRDNLIHELTHVLLTQNNISESKGWKNMQKDFRKEYPATRTHIIIHSIHQNITKIVFPARIYNVENYSSLFSYTRSWEIVNEIGAMNLIKKYLTT